MCECLSSCKGTQTGGLGMPGEVPAAQPGPSGCADLEWEPFCGIYQILLGKKPPECLNFDA